MKKIIFVWLLFSTAPIFGFYDYPFHVSVGELREINTQHFRIIFSDSSKEHALSVAAFAEEEFSSLQEIYGIVTNRFPIHVVVSTDYHTANAFGSPVSYPTIHMFTGVAPDLSGLISYTEPNRLRTLFRHELTHIVTFSALSGKKILRPLEYNFRPAVLLSAWTFIEGSAVQRESDSGYGRMYDPLHHHMLRRSLLDNKFPNFAQMSGAQTAYDTGHFRYTFGSFLSRFLEGEGLKDQEYWRQAGKWQPSAKIMKSFTGKKQKELWTEFKNSLDISGYQTNNNLLLAQKARRIHSLVKKKSKIYYYDAQSRILYYYDLDSKKNKIAAYGIWDKVDISDDEKLLLVSGTRLHGSVLETFTVLLDRKTLIPRSKPYKNIKDASFLPGSSNFVALRVSEGIPELVLIENKNIVSLKKGSLYEFFDSPIMTDNGSIFLLHSYNGKQSIARWDRTTQKLEVLRFSSGKFPRFLTRVDNGIAFAYAQDQNDFYKTALLQNNTLTFITNNFKGEMFEAVLDENNLIYKTSFSDQDNLASVLITNAVRQTAVFEEVQPDVPQTNVYEGRVSNYRVSRNLVPYLWVPFASLEKAGLAAFIFDSTGANKIDTGFNIEYKRGTPEFFFTWRHTFQKLFISFNFNNLYIPGNFVFGLKEHHLLSASLANQYQVGSPYGWGIFQIGLSLLWQGRLVGNHFQHPYTWNHLKVQQLVGVVTLEWRNSQSEGKFGFYRLWELVFQHKIDYLRVQLQSFEASVRFSPPILPVTFSFYSSYDTGFLTIQGFSLLGSTLMPQYREYSRYYVACRYAFYGSVDLQLYSWEIQNGPGLGEIFFERWTFYSGYRAAWWKRYFLQSVYFKTQLDISILYGNVPFGLFLEMHYGIFDKQLGFNYGIQSKLLF